MIHNKLLTDYSLAQEFTGDTEPQPTAYGMVCEDSNLGSLDLLHNLKIIEEFLGKTKSSRAAVT